MPFGTLQLTGAIAVTIYYFPEGQMQGDIDNIVKPILDAMCDWIYVDDKQVERVVVQRFNEESIYSFSNPSNALLRAMSATGPAVYIRVSDDPHEDFR